MKKHLAIVFIFFTTTYFSQNKLISKSITEISKADTVYFVADNSGCFNAYVLEIKMCKLKRGERKLLIKKGTSIEEKRLTAKQFKAFINRYELAVNHFAGIDNGPCTTITEFDLYRNDTKSKITSVKFKNTTCEAEFNPELYLQELLKK